MKYKTKMILTAGTGTLLATGFFAYSVWMHKPLQEIVRPQDEEYVQSLQVKVENQNYTLNVPMIPVKYSEEEKEELLERALTELEAVFLQDNEDLQHIRSPVSMPAVFPDTNIGIQWYLDSWEYINPDGTLNRLQLEEPQTVKVRAVLSLQDQQKFWERELCIPVPEEVSPEEKIELLGQQLLKAQEESGSDVLTLPGEIMGEPVIFYPGADRRWLWIFFLTVGTMAAMAAGHRQDEEKELRDKHRRMEMDYPEIVSRLSLYMGAGISTRKAWERIVAGYEEKCKEKRLCREAYEEMRVALREMESGMPETRAYERFGNRCRMPSYLKLGTLLGQNLRKGTRDLAQLLEEESREAFENRKALAKTLGEECETKLLLPMLLMLAVVLITIMYPAIISFQV